MMDYLKWMEAGKGFGLEGKDLQEFVETKERQYLEREERAQERDHRKKMEEGEMELRKLEKEAETRERMVASLELELLKNQSQFTTSTPQRSPKLPMFEEGKDDMDAFLERFERYAKSQKWDETMWAVSLSPLLTGKGLQVYTSLPLEYADNYKELKAALLRRYELTEEGFRVKFRESKPERGESVFQFMSRITRYFKRWTELAEVPKTFGSLQDLLVREQFLASCSADMALFLRERVPSNVQEMTKLAEQYIDAHGSIKYAKQFNRNADTPRNRLRPVNQVPISTSRTITTRNTCYICNKEGHYARDCKENINQRRGPGPVPWRMPSVRDTQWNQQRKYDRAPDDKKKKQEGNAVRELTKPATSDTGALCMSVKKEESPLADCIEDGQLRLANGRTIPIASGICERHSKVQRNDGTPVCGGYVGEIQVKVLRDTGCSSAAVKKDLIEQEQFTGQEHWCVLIDGTVRRFPIAKIYVDTPYYTGTIEAMCMEEPVYDLVIGNIEGAKIMPDADWRPKVKESSKQSGQEKTSFIPLPEVKPGHQEPRVEIKGAAVTTRAQAEKEKKPMKQLKVSGEPIAGLTTDQLKQAQADDSTLQKWWELERNKETVQTRGGNEYYIEVVDGIMYRVYKEKQGDYDKQVKQIVVPSKYRERVMSLAHESLMAGHLGSRKTLDRITSSFNWPCISSDVHRFCKSCDVCQRTIPKGKVPKVPLGEMPIVSEPFFRIAVDLIGPLAPVSERGHRYILTIVDYATRYPEAVPLRKIDTISVAEALLEVFSRLGFPNEILSDLGTQFTSDLMKEICRLVSIKQLFTTPYNPKCNGLTERVNGVLKAMLKRMCQERPKDWDRYIPAIMFAYREVPQSSTGFSPFELLYGRTVRGPMQVLKELWEGRDDPEDKNSYQYVLELRDKLEETCKIARENLYRAQGKFKHYYDKSAKDRQFKVGDLVLVLLPTNYNKLTLQWKGPFKVTKVLNRMDYEVFMNGKFKVYHANLLKRYNERNLTRKETEMVQEKCATGIAVVEDDEDNDYYQDLLKVDYHGKEDTIAEINIGPDITQEQKQQVQELLKEFEDIFTSEAGTTDLAEHKIELTMSEPIRVKPYTIPYAKKQVVKEEVEKMLEMGIIEPSCSPYNSPIVLVKKKDGTVRFCIDFRKLNAITKFDTEPMGNVEDILVRLNNGQFYSKFDLTKGYWQIPMESNSKEMTAFVTEDGCYQFKKMPFGLVNSGATFNRMMRKMLNQAENLEHYIDDVLCHTKTWEDHLNALRDFLTRIRKAGLTLKPSKCKIAYHNLEFLGHYIGKGTITLEKDKIQRIKDANPPETKKQVRAFLGIAGYYRKFIPNFAKIATPLTDLTRKGQPSKVKWGQAQDQAFSTLKTMLTSSPILHLPDFTKPFVVLTDASDTGIGAALMQEHNNVRFPIVFASRKLLPNEKNYSVIEKECLAIVYAVKQFQKYLYGVEFLLLTDHRPLTYIRNSKLASSRIMRWALFLQNFQFKVEPIKGTDNIVADYLSRC